MFTSKIKDFIKSRSPKTPYLIVDLSEVKKKYDILTAQLPFADCYYSIKANPAPQVIKLLNSLGSSFDTASINEIKNCLELGVKPEKIIFGNTIKKENHIKDAFRLGVKYYTFDTDKELDKITRSAPGCNVFCRITTSNQGAQWSLSRKFGCDERQAVSLLKQAQTNGLIPYGVSFHVGSQQTNSAAWRYALSKTSEIIKKLLSKNINVSCINIGGGFPAQYSEKILPLKDHTETIKKSLIDLFGVNGLPKIIIEPGRYIVAEAGVIVSEVLLVRNDLHKKGIRWIYLDAGKFNGLHEAGITRYPIKTDYPDNNPAGDVILAGPTCDGDDVLYDKNLKLPLSIKIGDKVCVLSAGAYTNTYSSINFNGFKPLKEYYI
ncbi:type III PLP-dependent enzyme [bacterium]|nr:type III PLP-dependent enzyme [bacterium]